MGRVFSSTVALVKPKPSSVIRFCFVSLSTPIPALASTAKYSFSKYPSFHVTAVGSNSLFTPLSS